MKNLSKFLLFVLIAFAGYFSVVVYGADCPGDPDFGYACSLGQTCPVGETCFCPGVGNIEGGKECGTDGERTKLKYNQQCSDSDGCICYDSKNEKKGEIEKNEYCNEMYIPTWNTYPIAPFLEGNNKVIVNGKKANFNFTSTKAGSIIYAGSCGDGSKNSATNGTNNIEFNLEIGEYNDCTIKVIDSEYGIDSNILYIPTFEIKQGSNNSGGGSSGGGSSSSSSATCTDLYLTCDNGIYSLKSGYYCVGGNLGKSCGVSNVDTGTIELLETIKEKNSTVYEYTPQGIKIRIYVPKFKQAIFRKTILSLNQSLYKSINKKLLKVTDPSYMIENFEYLEADSKILVYKEIGSIVKLYNDFLGIFYLFVDMGKKDYLPLARTYFESYLNEFAKFNK